MAAVNGWTRLKRRFREFGQRLKARRLWRRARGVVPFLALLISSCSLCVSVLNQIYLRQAEERQLTPELTFSLEATGTHTIHAELENTTNAPARIAWMQASFRGESLPRFEIAPLLTSLSTCGTVESDGPLITFPGTSYSIGPARKLELIKLRTTKECLSPALSLANRNLRVTVCHCSKQGHCWLNTFGPSFPLGFDNTLVGAQRDDACPLLPGKIRTRCYALIALKSSAAT